MVVKSQTYKTWLPIVLLVTAVIAGTTFINRKNQSAAKYVDRSGKLIIGDNSFSQWFGKPAPDFTVTDIDGTKHSISDYRGRNLMVIFWATWCPPCRAEIPHLIKLRNQEGSDKLAMLAISTNEDANVVKKFVKDEKINYTAVSLGNSELPRPFADVEFIPTTFFIDPSGRIKTVVVQSLNLEQIKAILEAKTTTNDSGDIQQKTGG